MSKMKVAIVPKAKADFEIIERDIPTPGPGEVRIKVQACGICLGDHLVKDGLWPGITYPRSPGHEISGVIDKVGPAVTAWKEGQRVGVKADQSSRQDHHSNHSHVPSAAPYPGVAESMAIGPIETPPPDNRQAVQPECRDASTMLQTRSPECREFLYLRSTRPDIPLVDPSLIAAATEIRDL